MIAGGDYNKKFTKIDKKEVIKRFLVDDRVKEMIFEMLYGTG